MVAAVSVSTAGLVVFVFVGGLVFGAGVVFATGIITAAGSASIVLQIRAAMATASIVLHV